ncbi:DUF1207 domain-containing protein [Melioribacteraceae bacterium 4301-Me]|uniref:DUF1207 domain-containing protein n=1 Tax=Pyranulibacter aquaticus TaxID=3163344 RepID=UPI0035977533
MLKKIFFVFLITNLIFPQDKSEFFPDKLNIQPFTANPLEPKLGFISKLNTNELRLDIGNSIDFYRYQIDEQVISLGFDLFTYTLLRSENQFHFPVDAVDYLFGINFGYKRKIKGNEFGLRTRISHISAHFVDGHFDGTTQKWRDSINPKVYSREFIELMPYYKLNKMRVYFGFTFLFHVDPSTIKKDNYQFGFDYFLPFKNFDLFSLFLGYDIKLIHLQKYTANNSLVVGLKFGKVDDKGISIYYNYYSGKSIHGQYFDQNRIYSAIGINLDL